MHPFKILGRSQFLFHFLLIFPDFYKKSFGKITFFININITMVCMKRSSMSNDQNKMKGDVLLHMNTIGWFVKSYLPSQPRQQILFNSV